MNLFLVDDHAGFRSAARALFESAGWTVVGEATGVTGAAAAMRRLGPDVALVDVHLADGDGFELVEQLATAVPGVRCVLVSSRRRRDFGTRFATSSAVGFVWKPDLTPARLGELLDGPVNPSLGGR